MHKINKVINTEKKGGVLQGKKILSIYYKHKPGGLCKRLYMMFDALAGAGAEVHYIAVEAYPISNPRIVPHLLWDPFNKKDGILFWAYFFLISPFYIFIIARREKIDMVSVFGAVYGFSAIFLKILLQTPILIFVRADTVAIAQTLGHPQWRLSLEAQIVSIALRLSDRIIAVNHPLKKILSKRIKIDPDKISVLHNNIEAHRKRVGERASLRSKLGINETAFVILTMAVLDQRKNIELLVRASEFLNTPAMFLILGEGPEKVRLEKLAKTTGAKAKITFSGWQSEVVDFIKASDLFVLPSKHEGCSNALLEALSFGLPCLVSDITENREILTSDELMFDPTDVNGFSDKIIKIMNDRLYFEKIKTLSDNVRKRFLFDWDQKIIQIHSKILF